VFPDYSLTGTPGIFDQTSATAGVGMDPTTMAIGGGMSILGGLLGRPKTPKPQAQPLDPAMRLYGGQMAGLGQGALGDLSGYLGGGFGGAYNQMYNMLSQANAPQAQQQTLDLENRLFQQGRLGSTGGAFQQQAQEQAYQQALQNAALQQTQGYMQMLAQMGEGMFSSLAPYKSMVDPSKVVLGTGLYTQEEQDAQQAQLEADAAAYQDMLRQTEEQDRMMQSGGE
jgi:hypothetical protein